MRTVLALVLFVLATSLLGPKLGPIDVAVLGPLLGVVVLSGQTKLQITASYMHYLGVVAVVLGYSILVYVAVDSQSHLVVLRHGRAAGSTALLGIFFSTIRIPPKTFERTILLVLAANAVAILAQIALPELQRLLAPLYGFDKSIEQLRAFGLTAGYDSAGYYCVIGAVLSAILAFDNEDQRLLTLGALPLFFVASAFTSRSTMALALFVAMSTAFVYVVKGDRTLRISAIFGSGLVVAGALFYVLPLILATISLVGTPAGSDYVQDFAATNIASWASQMWALPDDPLELLLGTGVNPAFSDIGYVKTIHMIGLVGTALMLSAYLYAVYGAVSKPAVVDSALRPIRTVLWMIVLLILVMNIKNLYVFTRGYHELVSAFLGYILGYQARLQSESGGTIPVDR